MALRLPLVACLLFLSITPAWAVDRDGNRSHEPNLRELTADLDGLRQLMNAKFDAVRSLLDERDKMYTERAVSGRIAVDAALTAAKELSLTSSANSKESIIKAENAQKLYNDGHNDLIRKGEEQAKHLISRSEVESIKQNQDEKLLRLESEVRTVRENLGSLESRGVGMNQAWNYLIAILGLLSAMGLGVFVTRKVSATPQPVQPVLPVTPIMQPRGKP